MTRTVVHLGALPPPIGGVSIHCARAATAMTQLGIRVLVLNLRRRGQAVQGELRGLGALRALLSGRKSASFFLHYSGSHSVISTILLVAVSLLVPANRLALLQHNGAYDEVLQSSRTAGRLHRRLVRRASVVMCLSEELQKATLRVDPTARTVRCASFIPSEQLHALRKTAIGRVDDPEAARNPAAKILVSSGYRNATYRYHELIDAVQEARDTHQDVALHLYCYGATDEAYWEKILARVHQDDAIFIHDDVPEPAWLSALSQAALYVRNTSHDSYGVAVAEAVFLGVPALATSVCQRAPGASLFQVGDTEALRQGIVEILDRGSVRQFHDVPGAMHGYRQAFDLIDGCPPSSAAEPDA